MSDILLVHGSCHGAWCWHRVIPALQRLGHAVRAIDLPAHGDDTAPVETATLHSYAGAILAAIDRPVLLVGHSAAGFPITLAAMLAPQRVTGLVYVAAYVPQPGRSLADMRRAGPSQPLAAALRVAPDRQTYHFDPAQIENLFYHDCPADDCALAARRLCPEPVLPQQTAFPPGEPAVPRDYIRCTQDRAIPPAYQAQMAASLPQHRISTLATSHSPFFAAPDALAQRLSDIAAIPL